MTVLTSTRRIPRPRTIRRVISGLWLMVALCALAMAGYQTASGQWHATPVLSGSMRPGLQPGDVVVTQRVPITDLRVLDVIVFHPPNEGGSLTVHRIVSLTVKNGTTTITTRGDANTIHDPTESSLSGTTAYRVSRVVPLLGYPAVWLQNESHGRLAIMLGVILLIGAAVTVLRPEKPAAQPDPADLGQQDGQGASASASASAPEASSQPGSTSPATPTLTSMKPTR